RLFRDAVPPNRRTPLAVRRTASETCHRQSSWPARAGLRLRLETRSGKFGANHGRRGCRPRCRFPVGALHRRTANGDYTGLSADARPARGTASSRRARFRTLLVLHSTDRLPQRGATPAALRWFHQRLETVRNGEFDRKARAARMNALVGEFAIVRSR